MRVAVTQSCPTCPRCGSSQMVTIQVKSWDPERRICLTCQHGCKQPTKD